MLDQMKVSPSVTCSSEEGEIKVQLVLEVVSQTVDPTLRFVVRVLGHTAHKVTCMPADSDTYVATEDTPESAAAKLAQGQISSFRAHPLTGMIRYVMINAPGFWGESLSAFLGTVEYIGCDYRTFWELALASPGLQIVCVGFEEGVELDDKKLTTESFPWSEWPLVIGAVRTDPEKGGWVIRTGPEIKWFGRKN